MEDDEMSVCPPAPKDITHVDPLAELPETLEPPALPPAAEQEPAPAVTAAIARVDPSTLIYANLKDASAVMRSRSRHCVSQQLRPHFLNVHRF
eukprot:5625897-Amphidinium_carterae.1